MLCYIHPEKRRAAAMSSFSPQIANMVMEVGEGTEGGEGLLIPNRQGRKKKDATKRVRKDTS